MNNEEVNVQSVNEVVGPVVVVAKGQENYALVNEAVLADMEPVTIKENTVHTEEQLNMDRYMQKLELASYFPLLNEKCIAMAKVGIKPEPQINTGALCGEIVQEAGMELLASIKKEIFDSKPEWEKEWIREGRISGAKLESDFYGDNDPDDVTPQDGRPKLTVEYLRSIGYDIDIS